MHLPNSLKVQFKLNLFQHFKRPTRLEISFFFFPLAVLKYIIPVDLLKTTTITITTTTPPTSVSSKKDVGEASYNTQSSKLKQ